MTAVSGTGCTGSNRDRSDAELSRAENRGNSLLQENPRPAFGSIVQPDARPPFSRRVLATSALDFVGAQNFPRSSADFIRFCKNGFEHLHDSLTVILRTSVQDR